VNTYKATCYECGGEVNPIATACPSCGAPLWASPEWPPSESNFHVARKGKRFGPYTELTARKYLAQGSIRPDDLCWRPGMDTWLAVSRVLQLQPTIDSHPEPEIGQLRARIAREIPPYESLTDSEKKTLLKITDYAEVPQPLDYGLTYYDLHLCVLGRGIGTDLEKPQDALKYKEQGKWLNFLGGWTFFLAIWFLVYVCGFVVTAASNPNIPGGWTWSNPRAVAAFFLGMAVPGFFPGFMVAVPIYLAVSAIPKAITKRYKRSHPNVRLEEYRRAVRCHELYLAARGEAAEAARKAARDAELRKRSYWTLLGGYSFEQATAEVLRKHQFTAIVTRGSGDGGIDIEVTRNGLRGVVQCKAHIACVGPSVVRDLYGVIHHCGAAFGIVVSRGGFTRGAADFARDKPILFLDSDDLIAMQEGRDVLAEAFTRTET
jgi:Restriction endonuclease/GYF domain 2